MDGGLHYVGTHIVSLAYHSLFVYLLFFSSNFICFFPTFLYYLPFCTNLQIEIEFHHFVYMRSPTDTHLVIVETIGPKFNCTTSFLWLFYKWDWTSIGEWWHKIYTHLCTMLIVITMRQWIYNFPSPISLRLSHAPLVNVNFSVC